MLRPIARWNGLFALAAVCLLAACAGQNAPVDQSAEAARYRDRTHRYAPPGPPEDPWRPYIIEASTRFDVPDRWIREVMRVESGGKAYRNGAPTTSPVGAMGLMQVMPQTYDTLRIRYNLGDDPYDPHDNILAGAAYIREMYDVYGSPGFLAAYNAGPKRLDDYFNRNRPLPDETRRYVAMIGPYIRDSAPARPSPNEDYIASLPIDIPPGPRRGRTAYASAGNGHNSRTVTQVAELPPPPRPGAVPPARGTATASSGFHIIPQAYAAESAALPRGASTSQNWAVQVGAYASQGAAASAAASSRSKARLAAQPSVETIREGGKTLYRARLVGLSRDSALQACNTLKKDGIACHAVAPDAQH